MRRASLLAAVLIAASSARAEDWLASAQAASNDAAVAAEPAVPMPANAAQAWVPYDSGEFHSELPAVGWYAHEEEDALGTVTRIYGPDSSSGSVRTTISVRLYDRSMPGFLSAKLAVEAMRREDSGRDVTPVHAMRVAAGLARLFEINETKRAAHDEGPSIPEHIHQYVAIIPRGESYYLIRMVSTRESYLDSRDVFARFVKRLTPIGAR